MALVRNPALSQAASGNVGALNYSHWRGRAIARASYSPIQPNTGQQAVVQAYFKTLVQGWKSVSTSNRSRWTQVAKTIMRKDRLGDRHPMTGFALFVSWNMARKLFGQATDSAPRTRQKVLPGVLDLASTVTGYIRMKLIPQDATMESWYTAYSVAGPFDSVTRRAIENEYRVEVYSTGFSYEVVTGKTSGKYYWVKAVPYEKCGYKHNRFEGQILVL